MGAQYLESLALQERGRGTLRQVRRGQVDAQRARNGERRIADRLLVAHADEAGLHDRRADGQVKVACSGRSEEHTSELQSLMRISYAVFCLKKKKNKIQSHKKGTRITTIQYETK